MVLLKFPMVVWRTNSSTLPFLLAYTRGVKRSEENYFFFISFPFIMSYFVSGGKQKTVPPLM